MNRKPSPVDIICLFTQGIEQLCINHADDEIEGVVRIRHDQEQYASPVSKLIKVQFIVTHDFTKLSDIKWRQSGSTADQNTFARLASRKLKFGILPYSKVVGVLLFKPFKQDIHCIFE